MLQSGDGVAPVLAAEQLQELGALAVVEEEEVDLVAQLVLDDAPGEAARIEQRGVKIDLAVGGIGIPVVANVDRDRARDQAPVEARGLECSVHGCLLLGSPAAEREAAT